MFKRTVALIKTSATPKRRCRSVPAVHPMLAVSTGPDVWAPFTPVAPNASASGLPLQRVVARHQKMLARLWPSNGC